MAGACSTDSRASRLAKLTSQICIRGITFERDDKRVETKKNLTALKSKTPEDWERELKSVGLPEHLTKHLVTMAELNRAGV